MLGTVDRVSTNRNSKDQEHAPGLLAGMRIRKKLAFLHTVFSLILASVMLITINPVANEVVRRAEADEARVVLLTLRSLPSFEPERLPENVEARVGSADDLGLDPETVAEIVAAGGEPVTTRVGGGAPARSVALIPDSSPRQFLSVSVTIPDARKAVIKLFGFTLLAILGVYAVIAGALELFVLPQGVYRPIRTLLDADHAVRRGDGENELIPENEMPLDELGEIMRSRNTAILSIREHENALADALSQLEVVAADLTKKNHMLEAAHRNLADADRLASLGTMSAGIAHELNTPLTVVKGLAERLLKSSGGPDRTLSAADAELLLRVVQRLERLGESLLDYARLRPPSREACDLAQLVDEARTLVRLDRSGSQVVVENRIDTEVSLHADSDRMVQVLVNVIRNAVDAAAGLVLVDARRESREGRDWLTVEVTDDGPGLAPDALSTLFEPFVSTKLDAKGTGLGLAVSQSIVRDHGGVITGLNRESGRGTGAVFRITLPADEEPPTEASPDQTSPGQTVSQ